MDMASKLFTFTFTFTSAQPGTNQQPGRYYQLHAAHAKIPAPLHRAACLQAEPAARQARHACQEQPALWDALHYPLPGGGASAVSGGVPEDVTLDTVDFPPRLADCRV